MRRGARGLRFEVGAGEEVEVVEVLVAGAGERDGAEVGAGEDDMT